MKSFLKEFKEFIATGNIIELAVALVIGLKVKDVIDSFMNGVVNPFIGGIIGKPNLDDLFSFRLGSSVQEDGSKGALVKPGMVLTSLINLIIVGLVLFVILRSYNKMKARQLAETPAAPTEVELLTEIRDTLRSRN
jgi:large conductance mechanosensitive channel